MSWLSTRGQPHPLSLVKSNSLLAVRLLVAAVKSKIAVTAEDMAVLNSNNRDNTSCGCTGATLGALHGSTPRGLARIHQLPMLGLLDRGNIVVDLGEVTLGLNIHFVDFLLRNDPASTRVATTSTATAGPATALPTASTLLSKDQDGVALGDNVILLQVLEVTIKPHDRCKSGELGSVNQDGGLDRTEGVIPDAFFEVMDFHVLTHILASVLKEIVQSFVLLHMGSIVLVEGIILAVTTVVQVLEGRNDVTVHGADLVTPKEELF